MLPAKNARADDESRWSEDVRSAMRLIAGSNTGGNPTLHAGVEIKLQPGWKTYWRYPGDSGVPPHFDFSGSENLKDADVLYPAPHLFTDETGQSLGYKDAVVFPILVSPQHQGKPIRLRLKLTYAVCEKLCIPAEGTAELEIFSVTSSHAALLKAAEARVPKPVPAADLGLLVKRIASGAKPKVEVELSATSGKLVEIFVEGPTPNWALPIPTPVKPAPPGRARFQFQLDGLPPGVDPNRATDLVFTVVTGDRAAEVKTRLD
ncbi:MAG TPA: protein-disulfide reductase DsbD domain-containing protein [Pseudolabrys sp.]|nr:protein-disulfide reductase DsbD domain-containing protein [Pseudolabrys sp.]